MINKQRRRTAAVTLCTLAFVLTALVIACAGGGTPVVEESPAPEEIELETPIIAPEALSLADVPAWTTPEPTPIPSATPAPVEPTPSGGRFATMELTQDEIDMLAAIAYLEAGNQSAEGQQAVVEVVLNRVLADNFPDSVREVLYQAGQFTPAASLAYTEANPAQYEAVDAALYGESILPEDVVYFSTTGENSRVWGTIGNHVFCYQYVWG